MLTNLYLQLFAWLLGIGAVLYILVKIPFWKKIRKILSKIPKQIWFGFIIFAVAYSINIYATTPLPIYFAMPPTMHSHAPGGMPASLPIPNLINFFLGFNNFEKIADIGADPKKVPAPINRDSNQTIKISLTAKEVLAEVSKGIYFNYWTYNGQVPGPMLRIREGDSVDLTLTNDKTSLHAHNIDLHAVTGPGGGATLTNVMPGESKTFHWKALNPGLYVYHCATPNVSTHNSHGQYGMILVEPKGGLPPVDKEFYLMQGELYTEGELGTQGLVAFNPTKFLDGIPTYITFNGKIEDTPRMKAKVGDKIRIFVGNGGVNLISSFHPIGEIFDTVYPEGSIGSDLHKNIQTTEVLPGGSSIVEFTAEVPGKILLVDHALARMNKGAWAVLEITGPENKDIFSSINEPNKSMKME